MKRKLVVWLCILSLITALAGCSKDKRDKKPNEAVSATDSVMQTDENNQSDSNHVSETTLTMEEGSYTEHEIEQPELGIEEYRIGSKVSSDNKFQLYTVQYSKNKSYTDVYCYTLEDDKFVKTSLDWAIKASKELSITPEALCQSEDGSDYMLFIQDRIQDEHRYATRLLIKKTEDETGYVDVTPSYWHEAKSKIPYCDGPFISEVKVSKNQILCYLEDGESELVFYDMNKEKIIDHESITTYWLYALKENKVYTFTQELDKVLVNDLEMSTTEIIDFAPLKIGVSQRVIQIGPNKEIIILDNDGLHIRKDNGTVWETIVDGAQNSMSTPSYRIESLNVIPGSVITYLVIYKSTVQGGKDLIVKYEPTANEVDKITKQLTICSQFDNPTIRMGIKNYSKAHPEVKIDYNVLWDMNSTDVMATRAEIIRTLNVEMLAGKGADILILDYLPVDSFIEKGVLMDFSDIFKAPGKDNIVLDSIKNVFTQDGKIYGMPLKFLFPCYASREDLSDSTKTVEDMAEFCKDKDTKLFATTTYKRLLEDMIQLYGDEIFAEDGSIKKDGLTSFLDSMDIIAKQTHAIHVSTEDQYSTGDQQDYYQSLVDSLMSKDSTIVTKSYIGSVAELERLVAITKEINGDYQPINDSFLGFGIVGINNATKSPDLAKDFVSSLFEEDIQSLDLGDGYPVNEKALLNLNIPCRKIGCVTYQTPSGDYANIFMDSLTEEDMKKFTDYVKTLTKSTYNDEDLRPIIAEGGAEYLEGKKPLDQVVDEIIQKYDLYNGE